MSVSRDYLANKPPILIALSHVLLWRESSPRQSQMVIVIVDTEIVRAATKAVTLENVEGRITPIIPPNPHALVYTHLLPGIQSSIYLSVALKGFCRNN